MIGRDKNYYGYCKKYAKGKDPDHVYSEFLTRICERKEKQLIKLKESGTLNKYCLNLIYGIINHTNDKFNFVRVKEIKIANFDLNEAIIIPDNINENLYKEALHKTIEEEGYWYNTRILEHYFDCGCNLSKVNRITGIPLYEIRRTIDYLKKKIKENYICLSK